MKLTLEQADNAELEVIIRGNLTDPQVSQLVTVLNSTHTISRLFLYCEEKEYLCSVSDILYFEAMNGKVFAHTPNEVLEAKNKLYELATMLSGNGFIQINKSMILNIHFLQSIEPEFSGNYIATLRNQKRLPISRKYFKAFRNYVMKEL